MASIGEYAQIVATLFVIADPVGVVPTFLVLTENFSKQERDRAGKIAAFTVSAVLTVSAIFGEPLLRLVGVSLASFRVSGGILLLLMAIGMLNAPSARGVQPASQADDVLAKADIAAVPLGIPLVAGPGAISAVIIYAHQSSGWFDQAFLISVGILVGLSLWLCLRLADPIRRLLGGTGVNIATRLLGLILAAVAIEFITGGLVHLLPGLGNPWR